MKTVEIKNEQGEKIGSVSSFRSGKMSNYRTMYSAIALDGSGVGISQVTFEDAVALLVAKK